MNPRKKRVAFRIFSGNRLTVPLLLNIWEKHGLDRHFDIRLVDAEPGRLTGGQFAVLRSSAACVYSFMTPHLPRLAAEVKAMRRTAPPLPLIVAGGPHVTGEQELARACGFDLLFGGAGEKTFLRFGRDLLAGKLKVGGDPEPIPTAMAPETGASTDPGWEDYMPLSKYSPIVPPLEIARGCFWKCRYCQTGGSQPAFRSQDSIALYLEELRRRGLPRVGFISPSALEFGCDRPGRPDLDPLARVLELCRRSGFRFIEYGIFPSEIRPDTVSPEALRLLRGFVANRRLTFGAQSASAARLSAIGRGHSVAAIENAVATANQAGFAANLDFIIALPGETAAERRQLLEFMASMSKKHRVFFQLHHFFPLAGSRFARRKPSFLSADERRVFSALKKNGLASDWWREGERTAREYFAWLESGFPEFFARFS
jgi:B12-binding domain/radical SAM domain protein